MSTCLWVLCAQAKLSMALVKQILQFLTRHFTDEGPHDKDPGQGSRYWLCNYCETRFVGAKSVLKRHFLTKSSIELVIRLGKHQASLIEGATGGSGGPSTGPSSSSFVPPASSAHRPSDGETSSPAGSETCFPPAPGSGGRSVRQTLLEEADNIVTRNEQTSRKMDRWLICTNQPFSMVENYYFLDFLDAVKKCHPSWWPCKRDDSRTKRLDGQYKLVGEDTRSLVKRWERTGCMLQMDGWSDRRNKPHLNVMVSSPVGTVFWKSVCMEGREKDSKMYFKLLDGVIQEIGAGSIVGVVMDNARVCAKAGKMVEAKYPGIFSVGCTAHALDLALEDMYKCMDWLKVVVDKGNQVSKFFTNVDKVRAMYNRIANAQLKRPAVTRFATNFEMLQSLKAGRNLLELCVCNAAWVEKLVRGEQVAAFNAVTHIIMDTNGFWKVVDKAIVVMEPVVKLLRLVDGPGATMSKVYFGMDAVVARMRTLDCLSEAEKADVEKILMDRWAFMTSELHCATAFLDPQYRTHTMRDTEIREGFNIWLYSCAPPELLRGEISRQVDTCGCRDWHFGVAQRKGPSEFEVPALWWEAFGGSLDLLQPQAIKLLGQASSSAACERNWSLHQLIFGQRRTKMLPERLNKLVYNNWNIQLSTRRERGDGENVHIPWKDDELASMEVDEWYDEWAAQVREGTTDDVAAMEVRADDFDDAPLERTWLQNNEEENFADDEDDIAALGSLERTWHANTKPGKHRTRELRRKLGVQEPEPGFVYTLEGRDRALKARQTGEWVHGREEVSGRGRRKKKATASDVAEEQPVQKRKRKVAEEDAAPKKKRGRPPLSPAKKAANTAARAEAARAAAAEVGRPSRKRTAEVIEDDEENPGASRKKQSSSSSSSSSEDSSLREEEETSQQSDDSGEADGDESDEDKSQAESDGEEQSGEEDE
ncbi:hypothetical protein CBR_g51946 [Chara braunii]|uniref:DUF659 domain-containing protein n=1 Tax=Chara braunii TaxID=69332 RepID=A0A388K6J7_CHABU|nr:hypothetical protein CBR_g51946 [Chara braunii]|eukprot:GBG65646.1 hypothetical protein CBR_g51946 [Chara braunii]